MVRARSVIAYVALAGLAATGCGGDESEGATAGSEADRRVIEEALLESAGDPNAVPFDEEQAACAADEILSAFGADRLHALGLDADAASGPELSEPPLTSEEADMVFAIFDECVDLHRVTTEFFSGSPEFTPEQAACVADAYLSSGVLREALFAPSENDSLEDRIDQTIIAALANCG